MSAIVANTGSNNWNTNGAWVGGVQPGAGDDVTIPATAVVTIPASTTVQCRSYTEAAGGTLVFAATTSVLNIGDATAGAGNVAFSNSPTGTITLTGIGTINFVSTSATQQTVTTGGKTMPNVNFNATSNGSWLLSDSYLSSGSLTLTQGTLNTGSQNVQCTQLNSNNTNVRTLTLGSSAITLTISNTDAWVTTAVTNLTMTANTAVMTITGASSSTRSSAINMNGLSLVFSGGGTMTLNKGGGTPTYNNITVTSTAVKTNAVSVGANSATPVIAGLLTLTGNSLTNRLLVFGNSLGITSSVNCANAPTLSNCDFMDVTAAGTGGTWSGTSLGDAQGNSNITFTTPVTRYAVASGNWSNTATWSSSSGGSAGASVPLCHDAVNLDANTPSGTIVADMPRMGKDVSWAGFTHTTTLSSTPNSIYGNFTLGAAMVAFSGSQGIALCGRGSQTITFNGNVGVNDAIQILAPGGTYTCQDNFSIAQGKGFSATNGTFDANGHNFSADNVTIVSTFTALKMGSGIWNLVQVSAGTIWNNSAAAGVIQCGTSTINLLNAVTGAMTFAGNGATYYNLQMNTAGSTGALTITGANTFNDILFSDASNARTIIFPASTTTTLTAVHALASMFGLSGKLITINSSVGGTAATLKFSNGYGGGSDWLSVKDITALTNTWYAGPDSTNVSGNTNVTFTAAPAAVSNGNFLSFF